MLRKEYEHGARIYAEDWLARAVCRKGAVPSTWKPPGTRRGVN